MVKCGNPWVQWPAFCLSCLCWEHLCRQSFSLISVLICIVYPRHTRVLAAIPWDKQTINLSKVSDIAGLNALNRKEKQRVNDGTGLFCYFPPLHKRVQTHKVNFNMEMCMQHRSPVEHVWLNHYNGTHPHTGPYKESASTYKAASLHFAHASSDVSHLLPLLACPSPSRICLHEKCRGAPVQKVTTLLPFIWHWKLPRPPFVNKLTFQKWSNI